MARVSKDELMNQLSAFIGDNNSDEAIALMENVSDSFESDGEDWKVKYEENDASWRKKYMERFTNIGPEKDIADTIETEQTTTAEDTEVVDESEGTISLEDIEL